MKQFFWMRFGGKAVKQEVSNFSSRIFVATPGRLTSLSGLSCLILFDWPPLIIFRLRHCHLCCRSFHPIFSKCHHSFRGWFRSFIVTRFLREKLLTQSSSAGAVHCFDEILVFPGNYFFLAQFPIFSSGRLSHRIKFDCSTVKKHFSRRNGLHGFHFRPSWVEKRFWPLGDGPFQTLLIRYLAVFWCWIMELTSGATQPFIVLC